MIDKFRARRYCSEDPALIENYSAATADKIQTWDIHHRGEILPCGNYSAATLKKYQLYYNRPASELIFLPHGKHNRLHMLGNKFRLGKKHTAAAKKKMSLAKIGKKCCLFGKHLLEDTKKKLAEYRWYTSGAKNVFAKGCPSGFRPGRVCSPRQ